MVSHFSIENKYRIPQLKKEVHLIKGEDVNIFVDVDGIRCEYVGEGRGISFNASSISLEETQESGDRYAFEHTLEFTVEGHVPYSSIVGSFYFVVVSNDDTPYILNPFFSASVSSTYNLGEGQSQTRFRVGTVSNYPLMPLVGFEASVDYPCDFKYPKVKHLLLNEKQFTSGTSENIIFTNDGFKMIKPYQKTISLQETFDGSVVRQELVFDVPLGEDGITWPYHLLEFTRNRYAGIIVLENGDWILAGFGNGLEPSYTVTANDSDAANIRVSLSNNWSSDNFIIYVEGGLLTPVTETSFVPVERGAECVNWNKAIVNLKAEEDMLGNSTGRFMARTGKKSLFPDLNLVDETFDEVLYITTTLCYGFECWANFNPPSTIVFQNPESRLYSMESNVDWWITCDSPYISISPSQGVANEFYGVSVENTLTPSETPYRTTMTLHSCGGERVYDIVVSNGSECFTDGLDYTISPEAQTVAIASQCCIDHYDVIQGEISNYSEIPKSFISFYVGANTTQSERQIIIDFTFCNGNVARVTITQAGMFSEWRTLYNICKEGQLCDVQTLYTGTSASDITAKTDVTRIWNCRPWSGCTSMTRWIASTDVMCYNAKAFYVEYEESSTNGGITWVRTGSQRIGEPAEGWDSSCEGTETFKRWEPDGTICDGQELHLKERLYISNDNVSWTPTDVYRYGEVIEQISEDCGTTPPHNFTKWVGVEGTICDGYTLYQREQMFISDNGITWTPMDIYRRGTVLDTESVSCGFPSDWEERWVLDDNPDAWQCGSDETHYVFNVSATSETTILLSGDSTADSYEINIRSTVDGADIGWNVTNVPDWTTAYKSGSTLVVDVTANLGNKREATFQLIQDTSNKVINVRVVQKSYTDGSFDFKFGDDSTIFYVNDAIASGGSVTIPVVSLKDGVDQQFIADNQPSSWLSGNVTSTGVTIQYGANSSDQLRTSSLRLIQAESGNELIVYVTQSGEFMPYVFEFDNHQAVKTETVVSGGTDYGQFVYLTSTYFTQPINFNLEYLGTAENWITVRIDGQGTSYPRLALKVLENPTQSQRQGAVELTQWVSGKKIVLVVSQQPGEANYVFRWSNSRDVIDVYKPNTIVTSLAFTNTFGSTHPTVSLLYKDSWLSNPSIVDSGQIAFQISTNTGETRTGHYIFQQSGSNLTIRANIIQYSASGSSFYFEGGYETEETLYIGSVGASYLNQGITSTYNNSDAPYTATVDEEFEDIVYADIDGSTVSIEMAPNQDVSERVCQIDLQQTATGKHIYLNLHQFGSPTEGSTFEFEGGGTEKGIGIPIQGIENLSIAVTSRFNGAIEGFQVIDSCPWIAAQVVDNEEVLLTIGSNRRNPERSCRMILYQPRTGLGIILNVNQEGKNS